MKPLVSILIPAYNAEKWLGATLESALGQTWPRKEVIVVDDGSTDRTLSVARKFERKGVTVASQHNQGAATARNTALSLAKGDYIQWLDADDLLDPQKIAFQMAVAVRSKSRSLLSSPWAHFLYRPQRAQFKPTELWQDLTPVDWLTLKLGSNLHMQPATWLVSREMTESAGPWDSRITLGDDGEYFCRVLLQSVGTSFVPEARTYYRMTGSGSLSNVDKSKKKLDSLLLCIKLHIQYLLSLEDSPRTRSACLHYLQTWLPRFTPHRLDCVQQLQQTAASLGGQIAPPRMTPKQRALSLFLGRGLALETLRQASRVKYSTLRLIDALLFKIEADR